MASVRKLILDILLELVDEDLKTFQFYLSRMPCDGFPHIPKSQVHGADRLCTVELLVVTYDYDGAVTVTVDILERMKLKLWAETLRKNYHEGKACLKLKKVDCLLPGPLTAVSSLCFLISCKQSSWHR